MTYVLAVDWLAVHCHYLGENAAWEPTESDGSLLSAYPWRYKLADFGTRQFKRLYYVSYPNAEGGWDDFAEVQATPHSGILSPISVIVRFVNRVLYMTDFWELAARFLSDNHFTFRGISRIDLCADFNNFHDLAPLALIEGFAAKKYRHIGRGVGALYFDHGVRLDKFTGIKEYGVHYTGLSFGTHSSDQRVYLYNKSFELLTVKDKPYIRDTWTAAGLDTTSVWRLEISIKSGGTTFKDKQTGRVIDITTENAADHDELAKIYHSFVARLFSFVKNRRGITNISREPRLQLFDLHPLYQRGVIRNLSCGNRFERMFIKALWQIGQLYRGTSNIESADIAQSFAVNIAESTDLTAWMADKVKEWDSEKPTHR